MMTCYRVLGAMLLFLPLRALAQTPPDPAALTKTVQKLTQRVERLEKEVAKLKGDTSPTAATAVSPVVQLAKKPKDGETVSVPGWLVDVLPAGQEDKESVVSFGWNKPEFNFGLHTRQVSGHNPFTYRGSASFFPAEKARYGIQLTLSPVRINSGYIFLCTGNLKINGEQVIDAKASARNASGDYDRNGEIFQPMTFSGGAEMEPPTDPTKGYVLTFQVSCFTDEQDHAQLQDFLFKPWQDNRFSILVKGPDDAAGRPFASDELYHGGKLKAGR